MDARLAVATASLALLAGCPAPPPPTPAPTLADPVAEGRVHGDARWTNAALGVELVLDRERWRLARYEEADVPRWVRLGGGGWLEVDVAERVAEGTPRVEEIAGWRVTRVASTSEARLAREVACVEVDGRILRLAWTGPIAGDGPPLAWPAVLAGLRRVADRAPLEGGSTLADVRATREELVLAIAAAGRRDSRTGEYSNPALGLRCAAPGHPIKSAEPGNLFLVIAAPWVEVPHRKVGVTIVAPGAHPRALLPTAFPGVVVDRAATIESLEIAGWRAAKLEDTQELGRFGVTRRSLLLVELGDRLVRFVYVTPVAEPSPLPALIAELEASLDPPGVR